MPAFQQLIEKHNLTFPLSGLLRTYCRSCYECAASFHSPIFTSALNDLPGSAMLIRVLYLFVESVSFGHFKCGSPLLRLSAENADPVTEDFTLRPKPCAVAINWPIRQRSAVHIDYALAVIHVIPGMKTSWPRSLICQVAVRSADQLSRKRDGND
jgi:hypothetical protein